MEGSRISKEEGDKMVYLYSLGGGYRDLENPGLKWIETPEVFEALRAENASAREALNSDGSASQLSSWDSHDEDIREFSRKYPRHIFELLREEGDGTRWLRSYTDGELYLDLTLPPSKLLCRA